jgi:MEMO1 family protein
MKYLKLCCVAPHPPIMVPEIGGGELKKIPGSGAAMRELADEVESIGPDTLVIMSPHSPLYADAFTIKVAPRLFGSFSAFGAPQVSVQSEPDLELASLVVERAGDRGVEVEQVRSGGIRGGGELDHGILVPLYFIFRRQYPLVCLSMSLLDYRDHYQLGIAVREAAESLGRSVVFIASGDMSHRLIPGAPAGYSPRGEDFDRQIVDIVESADFARLFKLDPALVEEAGECGLRSIFALAGAVDGYAVDSKVLSYEGPFGVGYLVARVEPLEPDARRALVTS